MEREKKLEGIQRRKGKHRKTKNWVCVDFTTRRDQRGKSLKPLRMKGSQRMIVEKDP